MCWLIIHCWPNGSRSRPPRSPIELVLKRVDHLGPSRNRALPRRVHVRPVQRQDAGDLPAQPLRGANRAIHRVFGDHEHRVTDPDLGVDQLAIWPGEPVPEPLGAKRPVIEGDRGCAI
jgi:hypothetical protein